MVKLNVYKNKYWLIIPKDKVARLNLRPDEEFDCEVYDHERKIVFVPIKKESK